MLKAHEAWIFTLSWPFARLFKLARYADAVAARVPNPSEEARSRARFTVVVRQGQRALRLDGADVYAATGHYAAYVAGQLAQGATGQSGVMSVAAALDCHKVAEDLALAPSFVEI